MNVIYLKYLSALRSFVQGSEPDKPEPEELQALMELAQIHSTAGILSYVYMSHPGLLAPADNAALRRQCLADISLYSHRAELAKLLAEQLDKNGIEFILFKGFVVRNYYPVPELRTFGDVDIIIHKEDRKKTDDLMLTLGYARHDDWEPGYSYSKGAEYYELHSRVIGFDVSDKADFVGYFGQIWDYTQPAHSAELVHGRELKPEFHFLYLLTHIAKHISSSGAGIRMYLDLAFFIRHYASSLDWNWIKENLNKLNLTDFAAVALSAVDQWFSIENPLELKAIADDLMEDFTEFTLAGGVYGYVGRDKGTIFLKQQNRNEEEVSKFKTLLFHAFPPADVLVNRYAYLEKRPWLLPAAWGQRFIDKRKELSRFAAHTKSILTANESNVLKLKRIYREIGL